MFDEQLEEEYAHVAHALGEANATLARLATEGEQLRADLALMHPPSPLHEDAAARSAPTPTGTAEKPEKKAKFGRRATIARRASVIRQNVLKTLHAALEGDEAASSRSLHDLFSAVPPFMYANKADVSAFRKAATERHFPHGSEVVCGSHGEGGASHAVMHLVCHGSVSKHCLKTDGHDTSAKAAVYRPGGLLLPIDTTAHFAYYASGDVKTLEVPMPVFEELCASDGALAVPTHTAAAAGGGDAGATALAAHAGGLPALVATGAQAVALQDVAAIFCPGRSVDETFRYLTAPATLRVLGCARLDVYASADEGTSLELLCSSAWAGSQADADAPRIPAATTVQGNVLSTGRASNLDKSNLSSEFPLTTPKALESAVRTQEMLSTALPGGRGVLCLVNNTLAPGKPFGPGAESAAAAAAALVAALLQRRDAEAGPADAPPAQPHYEVGSDRFKVEVEAATLAGPYTSLRVQATVHRGVSRIAASPACKKAACVADETSADADAEKAGVDAADLLSSAAPSSPSDATATDASSAPKPQKGSGWGALRRKAAADGADSRERSKSTLVQAIEDASAAAALKSDEPLRSATFPRHTTLSIPTKLSKLPRDARLAFDVIGPSGAKVAWATCPVFLPSGHLQSGVV